MKYKGKNYNPNYKKQKVSNSYQYEPKTKSVKIQESDKSIYEKSIDTLMDAIRQASTKNLQQRIKLYDIYEDILLTDDIVISLLEKRFGNIQNKKIVVVNENDEVVEDLKYFVESPKFRTFLKDIFTSKLWGFRTIEFGSIKDKYDNKLWFDYSVIPNKHINPYSKEILTTQWASEGKQFMDEKGNLKINNIMFIGDESELGLLAQISLLSLFGKRLMFNYSKYTDLAGDGFTTFKSRNLSDDQHIDRIMETFKGGKPPVVLLPHGDDLEYQNTSSSQQNQLFEGYIDMIEKRLSKLILGNTETSSDGSSYSQSMVHQEQQDDLFAGDIQFILDTLNYDFVDYLKLWGIESRNIRFKFVPTSQQELSERLNNWKVLKELGYVFSQEQIEEKFKEML